MIIVSHRIEHLVAHALFQAGVLITDQDAKLLRDEAIRKYWAMHIRQSQLGHKELSKKLTDEIILNRHRGMLASKGSLARQLEHLDHAAQSLSLSRQLQLSPLERDVLYLHVVVGLSEGQIIEKLGIYDDRIAIVMAKLQQIYGHLWLKGRKS